jgi:hypothetical protein
MEDGLLLETENKQSRQYFSLNINKIEVIWK